MSEYDRFIDAGNIKFRSCFRDSMYNQLKDKDDTGLFNSISKTFYAAFAVGVHFEKQEPIGPKPINHVNLVSIDRDIRELMIALILKKHPEITDPKELWSQVEKYAEYGIQVIFNSWKKSNSLVVDDIL